MEISIHQSMRSQEHLILKDIEVNKNLVKYKFTVTNRIAKFFTTDEMFIEYGIDVSDVPQSILAIPFVGSLIALTWLTDTVFWVKELDATFYNSLKQLKVAYQELYPHVHMKGRFVAARTIENHYSSDNSQDLLLFSGGVDAITSYLRNIDRELLLCNIQGWLKDEKTHDKIADKEFKLVSEFGAEHNRHISLIKSNFATLISECRFHKEIGRKLGDSWWHGFSHSMSFISISIPVAYLSNCQNIIIASSFTIGDTRVCASYATTDIEFKFCVTGKTIHDGFEMSRQDKIRTIVDHQLKTGKPFPLKVCSFKEANCSVCEKCFRTITGIIAEGANPNDFGFNVPDNITEFYDDYFRHNLQFFGIKSESISHWPHIKKRMVDNMNNILYKDFANWFLTYDFKKNRRIALRNYYRKNFFSIIKRKLGIQQ